MPTALPRKTELFAVGRLNRKRRAFDGLSRSGMGELRAAAANAAMAAAFDNLMALAHLYAALARRLDRAMGSPYALTEQQWADVLDSYARVPR